MQGEKSNAIGAMVEDMYRAYNCPQAKATPGPNAQPKALYGGVCEKSSDYALGWTLWDLCLILREGTGFILTICNYATRNPEAVALPSVEAPRIARELVHLCSQMGTPD